VARTYYIQYLKEHDQDVPPPQHITQDCINKLIGYIVEDKMSVSTASKKANVSQTTGYKYYRLYRKNRKRDAPAQQDQVELSTEHKE
jgi:transposase